MESYNNTRELKLSPYLLQSILKKSDEYKKGHLGKQGIILVPPFRHYREVWDFDKTVYKSMKESKYPTSTIKKLYQSNPHDFVDRNQIQYLLSKGDDLKEAPMGILTIEGVNKQIDGTICGIRMIPYLLYGYKGLGDVSLTNHRLILMCLRAAFESIKYFADNNIAHEHLIEQPNIQNRKPRINIIQNKDHALITGLYGPQVHVDNDCKNENIQRMYNSFKELLIHYYDAYGIELPYQINEEMNETKLAEMLTELDQHTRNR